MNKVVKTILEGALGIGALCLTAKVAYDFGHDVCEAEHVIANAANVGEGKPIELIATKKNGGLFGFIKAIKKGNIEAHIDIKPKGE